MDEWIWVMGVWMDGSNARRAGMQQRLGPGHGRGGLRWRLLPLPPPGHLPRASTCRAVREVAAADRRHRAKPLFRIDGPVAI